MFHMLQQAWIDVNFLSRAVDLGHLVTKLSWLEFIMIVHIFVLPQLNIWSKK
jgi:hypothetical protein